MKILVTDYNNYLKLRNDASAEFDKNSKDRNQLLRREWLRKSTNFMFKIKICRYLLSDFTIIIPIIYK